MNTPKPPASQPAQFIALSTHYNPLTVMLALTPPKVFLNGYPVATHGWGRTLIPVWPGAYHVHVHVPYLLPPRIGPGDCTVSVCAGQTVDLEYRAPLWSFGRGSLGPPPQGYRGGGAAIALFAAGLALLAVAVLVVLLNA